ncbi:unnamed protein product [Strongylus vulgaris]|uniref:Uncharacterized protein n=1 Tax=Strongylus vulgaris TaxID=40348 RepID=A0A3P7K4W5_STRVU|nr:unnamed protein product [Strongylus vulgaris]
MTLVILYVICIFAITSAYRTTRIYHYNGRSYKEIIDQPWFRYFHVPHYMIPVTEVNETNFGKHELPEDDVYVEHDWTDEETKYLPCMDLLCVCPYYGGMGAVLEGSLECSIGFNSAYDVIAYFTPTLANTTSGFACPIPYPPYSVLNWKSELLTA